VTDSNKMLWLVEPLNHQPHLKGKVQYRDASDSVSHEGQEDALGHQVLGTMNAGLPTGAKGCPTLVNSPLQAALQSACSKRFYLVLERVDLNSSGITQRFQNNSLDWGRGFTSGTMKK
jgi:hypothetical protein